MSDPNHPILAAPWTYRATEVVFRCASQLEAELDLTLSKDGNIVTLRFVGVSGLQIEEGFPWVGSGMHILDASSRGMETARIRVSSFEQDPAIRFWAQKVSIVAQPGAAPNGGPAKRLGNSGVTEGPPSVS